VHVAVNGVRLFFDVEGAALVPDGPRLREQPTLILLHGGPGFDHSIYKPAFSARSDVAQVIYLDQRGNGRSEDGPRESWTLAQWGDDVRGFCDALGIAKPIVYGASFGGMVALAYATRHPDHPAKLILVSTDAKGGSHVDRRIALFERFGGPRSARWRAGASSTAPTIPRPSSTGCAWRSRTTPACRAIPTRRHARSGGPRCWTGSRDPTARPGASTSSRRCRASPARPW
jgi:proline iminopeptidase